MEFGYEVIEVWERSAEEVLAGSLGMVPLAVLGKLPQQLPLEQELGGVIRRLVERLEREAEPGQAKKLYTSAFVLTGLRVVRTVARELFQGARTMHESDTYQAILEEGDVRGLQRTLTRQGSLQFGEPDESTRSELRGITDLERLDRMTVRLLQVSTWKDLLATP